MKQLLKIIINNIQTRIKNKKVIAFIYSLLAKFFSIHNSVKYSTEDGLFYHHMKSNVIFCDVKPVYIFSLSKFYDRTKSTSCVFYSPKDGDAIIDLGAGIGAEMIYLAQYILPNGRVYSIEASPKVSEILSINKRVNKFSNVTCHNIAISDTSGKVTISDFDSHQKNLISKSGSGAEIDSFTLDDFVIQNKIDKIDFLRVNIEGAEMQMIKGMEESIKIIDNVAISCHDFLINPNNPSEPIKSEIINFLKSNNFEIHTVSTGHLVRDSWIYGIRNKTF